MLKKFKAKVALGAPPPKKGGGEGKETKASEVHSVTNKA